MPGIALGYVFFVVGGGEKDTGAVLVVRDRRMQMLFAHVAARKSLAHEHGSQEPTNAIQTMAYHELIFKCDCEPALRSVR